MTVNLTTDAILGTNIFESPLDITPTLSLDFSASLIEGDFGDSVSMARTTVASVVDFEGATKIVNINEARFVGARRVENLVNPSSILGLGFTINTTVLAGDHVISMGAGSGTATFSGSAGVTGTLVANGGSRTAVTKTAIAGVISITASIATLADLQIEAVSDQTNQNPSDYVSSGDLISPFHGAGIDGVQYFTTENGNTVTSEIVTEAAGTAISDSVLKGYFGEYKRTNLILNSAVMVTQDITTSAETRALSFTGTGNVTLTGTFSDILFGTGANDRVSLVYTPTVGTLSLTVSGDVRFAQDEEGEFSSSWMPTDGTSKERADDSLVYSSADFINDKEGTIIAMVEMTSWENAAGSVIADVSTDPEVPLKVIPTNRGFESFDGTNLVLGPEGAPTGRLTGATRWTSSTMQVSVDGGAGQRGAYDGAFSFQGVAISVAVSDVTNEKFWFGTVKKLSLYGVNLTQEQINTEVFVTTVTAKYDISLDSTGDIATQDFFDTALLVSLFAEKRAGESEVPLPQFRRGWIGNESFDDGFEIGSKIWLYDQAKVNRDTLNGITAAAQDSLQWLITQGYATDVDVLASLGNENIVLEIEIFRSNSKVEKRFFTLWDNSGVTEIGGS